MHDSCLPHTEECYTPYTSLQQISIPDNKLLKRFRTKISEPKLKVAIICKPSIQLFFTINLLTYRCLSRKPSKALTSIPLPITRNPDFRTTSFLPQKTRFLSNSNLCPASALVPSNSSSYSKQLHASARLNPTSPPTTSNSISLFDK